ncbi:MAG: ATP-binding cassette domain-containing protein [Gammaproteobacteria bacterium]|nr:ATP-binding cassette domain-containing protein [Gammaproteobacteria bacterium]
MTESVLSIREFGVAFGEKIVLSSVSLDVPDRGVIALMGPAGTGKSTLLRTIAGFNDNNPSLRTWGDVDYMGAPLGELGIPPLVSQNARLMLASIFENMVSELPERHTLTIAQQKEVVTRLLERAGLGELADRMEERVASLSLGKQRHLAIARTAASNPRVLFIDEPTTGIDDADCEPLLNYIRMEGEHRAIVVILHNQRQVKYLDGQVGLLAGGWVQEMNEAKEFFANPQNPLAKDFVRSGSCHSPQPGVEPDSSEPSALTTDIPKAPPIPQKARKYISDSFGPRGFLWLKQGQLAGTPRPGLIAEMKYDLKALTRVGITVLVSLTETPVDSSELEEFGIKHVEFPIPDMGAPSIEAAMQMCELMTSLMERGDVLAVHCKAGLGRTGTILVSQLIWEGMPALAALEQARRIEPRWVQSEEQVEFLERFAVAVDESRGKLASAGVDI